MDLRKDIVLRCLRATDVDGRSLRGEEAVKITDLPSNLKQAFDDLYAAERRADAGMLDAKRNALAVLIERKQKQLAPAMRVDGSLSAEQRLGQLRRGKSLPSANERLQLLCELELLRACL